MPIINKENLSNEIKAKYKIVSNSFRLVNIKNTEFDKYTNTPKDLITVEVGDVKQPDFLPQLKLARWGNNEEVGEVNFSVRLIDTEIGTEKVSTLKDKIVYEKGNKKIEFYDYAEGEGGYKLVWYLKKKPKTNKVDFTIQSKSLDFFKQPALTEEYQNGYSEQFKKEIVVSETQVKDLEGNVLAERPENVVGSYAVYHSTKGGMNDSYGKDYKVGKAFHIYRPHIIDAKGKETWGILHIENGIYSVEIPQEFLDTAVYPIKSNDTFGYETTGGSFWDIGLNQWKGSKFTSPSNVAGAIISKLSLSGGYYPTSGIHIKGIIVLNSDLTIVSNGVGNPATITAYYSSPVWNDSLFGTSPSLLNNTDYVLSGIADANSFYIRHDAGIANEASYEDDNNYTSPTNPSNVSYGAYKLSIYATYTPAGGGTVVKDLIQSGIIAFPR